MSGVPAASLNLYDPLHVIITDHCSYTVINADLVKCIEIRGVRNEINETDPVKRFAKILAICASSKETFQIKELYDGKHVNRHIEYLANYLKYYDKGSGFNAATIVIEHKYFSLSYLKDFSNYYSIGYNEIPRHCKRIHFFESKFDRNEFEEYLTTNEVIPKENELLNFYYGHIVVKPLPNSIIGATLLRAYKEYFDEHINVLKLKDEADYNSKRRDFPALRKYQINLFGRSKEISSLVFQEQDRAISACATVALWMTFHKISELFRTQLPAPSEITKSAGLSDSKGRSFPSNGLNLSQIIRAIDSLNENTVSEVFADNDLERVAIKRQSITKKIIKPWKLKRYVYAYLKLEIPPLVGYNIIRLNGNHLVTITGYRKEKDGEDPFSGFPLESDTRILTEADRIQRLFSHDDQLGPYSKMGFNDNGFSNYIKVNWRGENKFNLAVPIVCVIPITNFIRIDYNSIESFAETFQQFISEVETTGYTENFIWDIYLQTSNNYKSEFSSKSISKKLKLTYQQKSFPQYIWVAKLKMLTSNVNLDKQRELADFIFDATDTPKSMNLFDLFYYDSIMMKSLSDFFNAGRDLLYNKYAKRFKKPNYLEKIEHTLNRFKHE